MRIPEQLSRLDRRLLPPISAALDRLGRGARRLRIVRILAPVISLAVVLVAVYAAGRSPTPVAGPIGTPVTLGVHQGGSIPAYVATTKSDLGNLLATKSSAKAPPDFYALVSLSDYLTPERLAAAFSGLDLEITTTIMRVPSDQQTEIISLSVNLDGLQADVERGMQAAADRKLQQVADDGMLLKQGGDSSTEQALRVQYRLEQRVAALEASRYRTPEQCNCVYATVVYGPLPVLAQLATRPGVRAVEARQLQYPSLAVFLPPFPDQYGSARPPAASAPAGTTASK